MSWLFSRALVEGFSRESPSAGAAFAPSSATPTPQAYSWPGKTTGCWSRFPSGMTLEPLTDEHGEALLTWFLAGSRAPISRSQDGAQGSTGQRADSGQRCLGLLARWSPSSCSWRTPQLSLVEGLDEFSETWPRWGLMRGGECWELTPWVLPTDGSGSGLWPISDRGGGKKGEQLNNFVAHKAPPQRWPTPMAHQGNNAGSLQEWGGSSNPIRKTDPELARAPLNPVWVAWLMGWPHADGWDWTSLDPAPAELMEMTWDREPPIPRVGKGIPNRAQWLKALGNGQVPQCAAVAWRLLTP